MDAGRARCRFWRSCMTSRTCSWPCTKPADAQSGEIPILLGTESLATWRVSKAGEKCSGSTRRPFGKSLGTCQTVAQKVFRLAVAERFRNLEGFAQQREQFWHRWETMAAGRRA